MRRRAYETEERRRAIKGGFATQRECQAALHKVLTAVEARTFVAPTRITVKAFLLAEWLPAVKGTLRPTTFASYTMLATQHIIPRLGGLQLQKLSAAAINALYAYLLRKAGCAATAVSQPPQYAAYTRCYIEPVATPCAGAGSRPTRLMPPIRPRPVPSTQTGCRSGAARNWRPFLLTSPTIASSPSGDCWP